MSMSPYKRTVIASVLMAGPGLVLWFGAPILPVAFGCIVAAGVLLFRPGAQTP